MNGLDVIGFSSLLQQNTKYNTNVSRARLADLRMHAVIVRIRKQCIYVIKVIIAGSTQHMSSIGLFYKNWGFYLEGCLTVKN